MRVRARAVVARATRACARGWASARACAETSDDATRERRDERRAARVDARRRLRSFRYLDGERASARARTVAWTRAEARATETTRAARADGSDDEDWLDGFDARRARARGGWGGAWNVGGDAPRAWEGTTEALFWRYARARAARGGRRFAFERAAEWREEASVFEDSRAEVRSSAEGFYPRAKCDHCATLGLKTNAFVTWDALRAALRAQALRWHPDRHVDEEKSVAEARFKRVYDAYEALSKGQR